MAGATATSYTDQVLYTGEIADFSADVIARGNRISRSTLRTAHGQLSSPCSLSFSVNAVEGGIIRALISSQSF